jgi:hypothetical protein
MQNYDIFFFYLQLSKSFTILRATRKTFFVKLTQGDALCKVELGFQPVGAYLCNVSPLEADKSHQHKAMPCAINNNDNPRPERAG